MDKVSVYFYPESEVNAGTFLRLLFRTVYLFLIALTATIFFSESGRAQTSDSFISFCDTTSPPGGCIFTPTDQFNAIFAEARLFFPNNIPLDGSTFSSPAYLWLITDGFEQTVQLPTLQYQVVTPTPPFDGSLNLLGPPQQVVLARSPDPGIPIAQDGLSFSMNGTVLTFQAAGSDLLSIAQETGGNVSGSGPYTLEAHLTAFLTSAPPPTLLQLAQASQDVYTGTAPVLADGVSGGYSFLKGNCSSGPCTTGFGLSAYMSSDKSQIIVAMQGTDLPQSIKDLVADGSFITGTPSSALKTEVSAAASFIAGLQARYPTATITLTGHSLGGAIAEMLGQYSGLSAIIFDAPGSGALYSQLTSQMTALGAAPFSGLPGIRTNYRIYGDQFGSFGTPGIYTTVTLPSPFGDANVNANPSAYMFANHDPSTIVTQIQALENGQITPDSSGPNITNQILATAVAVTAASVTAFPEESIDTLGFLLAVAALEEYFFDPTNATDYLFTESAGSPNFACVDLPVLPGGGFYNIRSEVGSTWSPYSTLTGGNDCFASQTDALEFEPMDITDPQFVLELFGLTFDSPGELDASLAMTEPNPVPEPSTLILLGASLLIFTLSWRLRGANSDRPYVR